MGNWLFLQGARAFTAKCEIRYRQPLPVETTIDIECRMKVRKRRLVILESRALRHDDHAIVAEAEASFMIDDPGQLGD